MKIPTGFLLAFILSVSPIFAAPNYVVIFIDDMGYGDIGPFGPTVNDTPNLDRMAAEGMKLTTFYVAASVCTPSRAALMTGSYPRRIGLGRGSDHAVLFPGDAHALHPDEITIAEMLKEKGYATGCFGKWHLGDQNGYLPSDQGFDTYFGIPYSNDMWPEHNSWPFPELPIMEGNKVVGKVPDMDAQAALCRQFTKAATDFIHKNKDQPFFVYLPHAFVHHPRAASPEFMANAENETEAQIEEVDWSAGQILDTIRELDLAENTLVIFTSDNGGARGCSNAPLRGGKGTHWEGGFREPTLAWWPGTIPADSTCDEVITAMDLFPTFAKLSGGNVPTDRVIDGKDISPLLLAEKGAKSPHDTFYYNQGNGLTSIRSGKWKLSKNGELYDLEADIAESKDVSSENPEVVKRIQPLFQSFEVDLAENSRPVGKPKDPKTRLPRPGVSGDEAYAPTLTLQTRKKSGKKK